MPFVCRELRQNFRTPCQEGEASIRDLWGLTLIRGGNMKNLIIQKFLLGFVLIAAAMAQAQSAPYCSAQNFDTEFCKRMKHLRATVRTLEAQDALMQINYEYLTNLSKDLNENTEALLKVTPPVLADHQLGLKNISKLAEEVQSFSAQKNADAMIGVNRIKKQCLACHDTNNPQPGIPWNDTFGNTWEDILKDCSREGQNPYMCKSMNAMMTNYNQLATAYNAKIESYESTSSVAKEVMRILQDLKAKGFKHFTEASRAEAETNALEVVKLAANKNPLAFEKANNLVQTCNKCHESQYSWLKPVKNHY